MVLAVIVAFAAAAILVGLLCCGSALCWVGLYGMLEDDHQHCAVCGYDLSGWACTPEQCTECGADLRPWLAVAVAPRRVVFRSVLIGIVLIVSGSGPIAAALSM